MTDEELREAWRQAGGHFFGPQVEHGSMPESKLLPFLRSLSVPAEGWQLVPIEPTQGMLAAMVMANDAHNKLPAWDGIRRSMRVYKAMLDAAPKP